MFFKCNRQNNNGSIEALVTQAKMKRRILVFKIKLSGKIYFLNVLAPKTYSKEQPSINHRLRDKSNNTSSFL